MVSQSRASTAKGSQKWIRTLVNDKPQILDSYLREELSLPDGDRIEWLSPLRAEGHKEYFDQAFLDKLGVKLEKRTLKEFWPKNGPHWDALGKTTKSGKLLLVEAKSHVTEMVSSARAAPASLKKIKTSLTETKNFLGSRSPTDWTAGFYQYVNRLAHLYLLRHKNGLPAYLIFIYFLNDHEMSGPTTKEEWQAALDLLHAYLGLGRHKLQKYITEAFIDVSQIQNTAT